MGSGKADMICCDPVFGDHAIGFCTAVSSSKRSFRPSWFILGLVLLGIGLRFSASLAYDLIGYLEISTIPPIVSTARARVGLGAQRQEVLLAFDDAWFHGDCRFADGSGYDIFLYGEASPEAVRSVFVRYALTNGEARVDFIGTEEPYRLKLYSRCLPQSVIQSPN